MKRRMIVLVASVMLIVGIAAANSFAYSTTTEAYLGSVTSGSYATAWGRLNNNGGVAELQIRDASGIGVHSRGTYPANPQNQNKTTYPCSPGETVTFYAVRISGSQIWGSAEYGIE